MGASKQVLRAQLDTLLECGLDPNATDEQGNPFLALLRDNPALRSGVQLSRQSVCALVSAGLDLRALAPPEEFKAALAMFDLTTSPEENRRIARANLRDRPRTQKLP